MSDNPIVDIAVTAARLNIPVVLFDRTPDEWLEVLRQRDQACALLRQASGSVDPNFGILIDAFLTAVNR